MRPRLIIDCDPGHDDALAIMLAAGDDRVELAAITTVAGNQTLDKVTRNALAVCTVAGIHDVPVAAGATLPLVRDQLVAPEIHGEGGMEGPELPEPTVELDPRHGVDLIIDTVMASAPGEITLVPTGPLTNIALAMRTEPAIVDRVAGVVLMGGAYGRGNRTPNAEFNIVVDPEAAAAVFAGAWPVTMVGLDLTHQALATPRVRERIAAIGTPVSTFVEELLDYFGRAYSTDQGFTAPPVHDMCAVAAVIDRTVMTYRETFVTVELAGTWTYGTTVTDFAGRFGRPANTSVATVLDHERLWSMAIDAFARLPLGGRA